MTITAEKSPVKKLIARIEESEGTLSDIYDYAHGEVLPQVPWLTTLKLETPRQNLICLGRSRIIGKRLLDIIVALTLLILTSPIMLVTAILVKLTSPGPIIFKQKRIGLNLRNKSKDRRLISGGPPEGLVDRRGPDYDRRLKNNYGKEFIIYKFRTMRTDAEKNGAQLAVKNDARITPIGKFLRKTRIDELPQLLNVLNGEMSMVGPRPERPEFIQELSVDVPNYIDRLGLKPGLTGVAQVVNGYDNDLESFKRKVAFDLLYLQNCCLRNDLKILWKTVWVVITGKGAL